MMMRMRVAYAIMYVHIISGSESESGPETDLVDAIKST